MKQFDKEINRIFKPLQKIQIVTAIIFIVNTFIRYFLLVEIQQMTDSISTRVVDITWGYLRDCVVLAILFFLLNCICQYLYRNLEYTSHYSFMENLFALSLEKDCSFHEKYVSSSLLSMIKDDSKFISDWKSTGIITVIGNIISFLLAFGIMLYYNIWISIAVFLIILLCFLCTQYISKAISHQRYQLQVSNTEISNRMVENFNGIKEIKQYKKETFFKNQLSHFIEQNSIPYSKRISRLYSAFTSTYAMLVITLPIFSILIGVVLILKNQLTIGELIAIYAVVSTLQEPVQVIPDYLNQRQQALAIQEKIMPILEKNRTVYSVKQLGEMASFTFDSDGYRFEDGKTILKDVRFKVKKGETVIIKGSSGKGKSSLFQLISRYYNRNGQEVKIKYNGIEIETIDPNVYYDHVMQLQQMPYIFKDTIFHNLTMGETYSKEELEEVIQTACLEELIEAKGYDYQVEQNGENLSGGQKQRMGLARVLLRKPDLLMLDEPTSALNPELVTELTKKVIRYCRKNQIALLLVSHQDSFERYFQKEQNEQVTIISV